MTVSPVLITGSGGRLGRALRRVGSDLVPIVGLASSRGPSELRTLDITDAAATEAAIGEIRPRVIIHLASIVGSACEADPARAEAVNVGGTASVAAAAAAHGVERLIFVSTSAVYGDSRRHPVSESEAPAPAGVYGATKLRAEEVLTETAEAVAIDVLRVFNIYGAEMPDSLVTRLQLAKPDAPVHLSGVDGFVRDYVHIDDVARAVFAATDSSARGFRVLNVGTGIPRTNRELLDALPESVRAAVVIGPEVESYSCADITAIKRELAWRPTMPWPPDTLGERAGRSG